MKTHGCCWLDSPGSMSSGLVLAAVSVAQPSEKPRACFCTNSPAVADLCVLRATWRRQMCSPFIDVSDRRTIVSLWAETHGTYHVHLLDEEICGRMEWKICSRHTNITDLRQFCVADGQIVSVCPAQTDAFWPRLVHISPTCRDTELSQTEGLTFDLQKPQRSERIKQILGKKLCFWSADLGPRWRHVWN